MQKKLFKALGLVLSIALILSSLALPQFGVFADVGGTATDPRVIAQEDFETRSDIPGGGSFSIITDETLNSKVLKFDTGKTTGGDSSYRSLLLYTTSGGSTKPVLNENDKYQITFKYKVESITTTGNNKRIRLTAGGGTDGNVTSSSRGAMHKVSTTSSDPAYLACTETHAQWKTATVNFIPKQAGNVSTNQLENLCFVVGGTGIVYIDDISVTYATDIISQESYENRTVSGSSIFSVVTDSESGSNVLKFTRSGQGETAYASILLYENSESTKKPVLSTDDQYRVTFEYKVTDLTTSNGKMRLTVGGGSATEVTSTGRATLHKPTTTSTDPAYFLCNAANNKWETATVDFIAKSGGNVNTAVTENLCILIGGSGTVYIDNVKVFKKEKITYNVDGDTTSIAPTFGVRGDAVTLTSATPEKSGYEFAGWKTESGENAPTAYNGDVTLVAQWKLIGDLNNDGAVDMADVNIVRKDILGTEKMAYITPADFNKNGSLDVADLFHIKRLSK